MTEFETKELTLFKEWYLDYSHEGNISDRSLEFMEDAWLARATLYERQTTLTTKDSSSN